MNEKRSEDRLGAGAALGSRKPYKAPTLSLFGQVAALTQAGSCSEPNDNDVPINCVPGGMGMNASDRRAKDNIVQIGEHPLGFGLYLFDYKPAYQAQWGSGRQFGVMADEVERVVPSAVATHEDGYKVVCYDMLGISRTLH